MFPNYKAFAGLTISAIALVVAGLACSQSPNNSATNATGPALSNTSTSNSTSNAATPAKVPARPIAGEYDASGTNPDGAGTYKASLTVTPRDDVYQFSWTSGSNKYEGVGVQTDSAVAVAYTTGTNGQGCGVVLYKVNADGSLDGKVGYWGENKMETERAVRKSGTDIEGEYDISGKNPEGQEYKGSLKVKKEGVGYIFNWTAPDALEGFGIRAGDLIAVGFGGKQCAFVGYDVESDGTLDGTWGGRGAKTLGTEVAKRK